MVLFKYMPEQIQNGGANFGTVAKIIELLEPLSLNDREHVIRTVTTWFRVRLSAEDGVSESSAAPMTSSPSFRTTLSEDEKFSDRPVQSAKEFLMEKDPITEVERLACLAYYLTHFQETPQFKNIDLSRLNTEAAQRKLSNPAVAVSNAMRDGFFVQASKTGYKQLSAMGERFVQLLPNREAAQKVKQRMSSRRSRKAGGQPDLDDSNEAVQEEQQR
jgi:hypothetical protein